MFYRIFQIGFHVCGTRSLYFFFLRNNFKAFHHHNGELANSLYDNLNGNVTYLSKELEGPFPNVQGVFYSDMEDYNIQRDGNNPLNKREGYKLFKEIDNGYPNSLFILNTRNDWVDSKMKKPAKSILMKLGMSEEEIRKTFQDEWNNHLYNVRMYFLNKDNLIEFNIQKDTIDKLTNWLKSKGIDIISTRFDKIKG